MIIELLGTGGSGKTTIEPLLASALEVPYFPGKKRHDWTGEPLTGRGVWLSRARDVLGDPALMVTAMATSGGVNDRLRLALDLARRERHAKLSHDVGSGVVGSGGLHRLSVAAARKHVDVSRLARRITLADIYVLLVIDAAEATRRLSDRLGDRNRDLSEHEEETQIYVATARELASDLGRTLIEMEALGTPQVLADRIAARVKAR